MAAGDAEKRKVLPVINGHVAASSIGIDGVRRKIYPADVKGRFQTLRKIGFFTLIATWIALPLVKIGGNPAVFLDVAARRFYLFGATFNAQDLFGLAIVLTGIAFSLVLLTAMLGRVWCGYACPQTVFLEGIFRPLERLIGGSAAQRMKHENDGTAVTAARKVLLHVLYLVAALFVAHVFVGYFVSLPRLFAMVRHAPAEHPEAFIWMLALTGIFYFNFSWFREQTCLVICPYGRMQSILFDEHSIVIGYDSARGEPRGKRSKHDATEEPKGACVDCDRCVRVCPTGIDIRNGLQIDCIACAACVDACDEVMEKLGEPRGLIRYDSRAGLTGGKKRIWRPRVVLYLAVFAVWATVAIATTRAHHTFEANLLRSTGAPFVVSNEVLTNSFEVHLVNKQARTVSYVIEGRGTDMTFIVSIPKPTLAPMSDVRVPIFVSMPEGNYVRETPFEIRVTPKDSTEVVAKTATFLGAPRRANVKVEAP